MKKSLMLMSWMIISFTYGGDFQVQETNTTRSVTVDTQLSKKKVVGTFTGMVGELLKDYKFKSFLRGATLVSADNTGILVSQRPVMSWMTFCKKYPRNFNDIINEVLTRCSDQNLAMVKMGAAFMINEYCGDVYGAGERAGKLRAEAINQMPELKILLPSSGLVSFCGIKFGDELPKTPVFGDQRTKDGKSLMRTVKLQKPFQGMDHATVFASIKTRKICCVQLEWTKEGLNDDEVPEGKSIVNAVRNRYLDAEKIVHDMPDGFMNLYSEEYKVAGGKVSIEWVQRDFMYPPTRLQLTARNDEFMRLAEEEYNQESGGDGSSVL